MKLWKVALALLAGAFLTSSAHAEVDSCTLATAGTTQGTATTLPCTNGAVTTSTADQGVIIPALTPEKIVTVTNSTANRIKVYPPSGASFNGGTVNVAITLQPNSRGAFMARTSAFYHAQYNVSTFSDLTATTLTGTTSVTTPSALTATNNGTVTTSATTVAEEHGDGVKHWTKLTMTAFVIGTSADNASLAIGAKFYTWPTSTVVQVDETSISGAVTCAISITTNTPEVGIGTVIASGANATLTTATWENLVDGGAAGGTTDAALVAPDVAGGAFSKTNLSTIRPIIKASGGAARDLFLNAAAAWADVAAAGACTFTGTILLEWRVIG